MSTNRIRPGSSIADLLLAVSTASAGSRSTAANKPTACGAQSPAPRDPAVLRRDLAALVGGVDLDSDSAVRTLQRPVVRRILLWEFGESFLEHPDFNGAIENIESAMASDPAVPIKFRAMLKQLQGSAR